MWGQRSAAEGEPGEGERAVCSVQTRASESEMTRRGQRSAAAAAAAAQRGQVRARPLPRSRAPRPLLRARAAASWKRPHAGQASPRALRPFACTCGAQHALHLRVHVEVGHHSDPLRLELRHQGVHHRGVGLQELVLWGRALEGEGCDAWAGGCNSVVAVEEEEERRVVQGAGGRAGGSGAGAGPERQPAPGRADRRSRHRSRKLAFAPRQPSAPPRPAAPAPAPRRTRPVPTWRRR